jgi:esterase/lipase superfamily enzyme
MPLSVCCFGARPVDRSRRRPPWRRHLEPVIVALGLALAVGAMHPARGEDAPQMSVAPATVSEEAERSIVEVLYVTDRNREQDGSGLTYGGERGALDTGRCAVTYSPIPVLSDLAQRLPFYVPGTFQDVKASPFKEATGLYGSLERWLDRDPSRKLVLFVHGYSFTFERACRRAAALQDGLGTSRRVVLFTWPSEGDPTDYTSDATDMEWSIPDLMGLIADLEHRFGPERLQMVAHSMGTKAMVIALDRLRCTAGVRRFADELVLIAPDIDREIFLEHYSRVRPLTGPVTLYASENDTPLGVSRQLHGHPRLGQAGDYLTVLDGMETIDVTPVGRYQITGHEYHYYHPRVAADLRELLSEGRRAQARSDLEPQERDGRRYWSMKPLSESGPSGD